MIITIARQCGCMGDQIGKALAEKYFIPFYDKDAVCRLAKEKGLYEKYPYFMEKCLLICCCMLIQWQVMIQQIMEKLHARLWLT